MQGDTHGNVPPNILEVMSFSMSTRVTATVVCCILMQILCVVSRKASASGGLRPQTPYRGSALGPRWGTSVFFYVPPIIMWDRRPWHKVRWGEVSWAHCSAIQVHCCYVMLKFSRFVNLWLKSKYISHPGRSLLSTVASSQCGLLTLRSISGREFLAFALPLLPCSRQPIHSVV